MIIEHYLTEQLQTYKRSFAGRRWAQQESLGLWKAIASFQASWDLGAANFPQMLQDSLGKALDLLGAAEDSAEKLVFRSVPSSAEPRSLFRVLIETRGISLR